MSTIGETLPKACTGTKTKERSYSASFRSVWNYALVPNEFSQADRYEMKKWCFENCEGRWSCGGHIRKIGITTFYDPFWFASPHDQLAFMLRFGLSNL